eukprot:Skav211768  [mRNA]  locus=scaffold674:508479:513919:+ [translate_table: standard]
MTACDALIVKQAEGTAWSAFANLMAKGRSECTEAAACAWRDLYPYCHKQHHRQFVPFRGYADAANQHPLEQMYGFAIWICSLWIISKVQGLHAATAWFGTLAWAVLNICNHLPFDTRIHLPLPCAGVLWDGACVRARPRGRDPVPAGGTPWLDE